MSVKQLFFTLLSLITLNSFSQDILIKDNIAFIDNQEYVKIIKKNDHKYLIKNLKTDKKIIVVKTFKAFNSLKKEYVIFPKVTFVDLNKTWRFETENLLSEIDIIKFIYNMKIVFLNGEINRKMALNYYEYFKNLHK